MVKDATRRVNEAQSCLGVIRDQVSAPLIGIFWDADRVVWACTSVVEKATNDCRDFYVPTDMLCGDDRHVFAAGFLELKLAAG